MPLLRPFLFPPKPATLTAACCRAAPWRAVRAPAQANAAQAPRRDTGDETLIDIACGYNVVSFVGAVRERDWQSTMCSGQLA
jgi:hypothetical protein